MTTVLFVHGTGVRNPGYEDTFKLIEQKLLAERPDLKVERCLWGDSLGTKLNAKGASIPLYDTALALDEGEEEDYQIILWEQLYCDLEYGEPLPDYFPSWLNIYDLRDFLSYIAANVFPNKVQDVLVDSKQPFPRSHGAYWTNDTTWKAIIPRIP